MKTYTQDEVVWAVSRCIAKGYSSENLCYGDDLYEASDKQKEEAIKLYIQATENGLKWLRDEYPEAKFYGETE